VNWFKRHLNLTWIFGALFVAILASLLITFVGFNFFKQGYNQAYFFIWCMLPLNGWILLQKGRNLNWLWLAFFFVPFIPIVLGNKKQRTALPKENETATRKTRIQKPAVQPLKFNKPFYILGIVFSSLIALGILISIPILATSSYQKESYLFYILDPSSDESAAANIFIPTDANFSALLYGHTSQYFSGAGYSCIELSDDT
jgi:hypothetical protein